MGGQLLANVLLPIFVLGVLQWDYTTGQLQETLLETLNARTASAWSALWNVDPVPTYDCTEDAQQLHVITCENDIHKDTSGNGGGSRRRRSLSRRHKLNHSVFLSLFEANNFLGNRKRSQTRVRRTTFSAECCDKDCVWEEVAEYCWHSRVYHES